MKLRVTTPGQTFEVSAPSDSFTVGKDADNGIRVQDDPAIAGRHTRFERFMDRWSFSDLFTATGTLHNGKKEYSGEIAVGDSLKLGDTRIDVLALGKDAAADPSPFAPQAANNFATPAPYRFEPAPSPAFESSALDAPEVNLRGHSSNKLALAMQLAASLETAAERDEALNSTKPEDRPAELAELAWVGVTRAADRARSIWLPVLADPNVLFYDLEEDLRGDLEVDTEDIPNEARHLADLILREVRTESGVDLRNDSLALTRVYDEASNCAEDLRSTSRCEIRLPWLYSTSDGSAHFMRVITQEGFNLRAAETLPNPARFEPDSSIEATMREFAAHGEPTAASVRGFAQQVERLHGKAAAAVIRLYLMTPDEGSANPGPVEASPSRQAPGQESSRAKVSGANPIFVNRLKNLLAAEFERSANVRIHEDPIAMTRVEDAATKAVIELEHARTSEVNLPFLRANEHGPQHLRFTVERKHLHERAPDEQQPHRTPPSRPADLPGSSRARSKPSNKGGAIFAGIFIAVVAFFIIFGAVMDSIDQEDARITELIEAEREEKATATREELIKQLNELSRRKDLPPEDLIEAIDAIEMLADQNNIDIDYNLEATLAHLKRTVYSQLSLQFNKVSGEVYDLTSKGTLVAAEAAREDFHKHYTGNVHRAEAAKQMKLDEWNERATSSIARANRDLIEKRLREADEALDLREYAKAADAIDDIVANAVIESLDRTWFKTEVNAWREVAKQQADGRRDPAIEKPKRPARPPATPRNDLYPLGGTTASRLLTAVRERTLMMLRDNGTASVPTTFRGYSAAATGNSRNSIVTLKVSRFFLRRADLKRSFEFETEAVFQNLPAETQLGLMKALPDLSLDNLLGMLHLCFENHLDTDVGLLASRIRAEFPHTVADLDQVLAAKWAVPVPEGGFPERDGRVVPE